MDKRPDMFERLELTDKKDIKLVDQIKKERSRMKLTQPIGCRPAVESDIEDIMLIVRQARNYLKKHRVDQWQGEYPTQDIFAADIANGECYAVTYGERLAGFFCLTEAPESGYDKITDGKWHGEGKYCTLHRMAIEARFRGTGLSDMLVDFADETAKAKGAECVRTDTHRKNKAMQKLLKRKGYVYRGNVLVSSEPGHDQARQAFEKKI